MKKKRSKLQWLACLLVAALMMTAGMPATTVWALEEAEETTNSPDLNVLDDDLGGGRGYRVNYNGSSSPVYRGGNDFTANTNEVKIDTTTGLLKTSHGISLNVNPNVLDRFGGAYKIESIPAGLNVVQRGINPEHFEIVPTYPMTFNHYQNLLYQIKSSDPE